MPTDSDATMVTDHRAIFQVATDADRNALQERLANRANWIRPGQRPEDMAAREHDGVEMFLHPHDPTRARAWMAEAFRPFTGEFPRRVGALRCPVIRGNDRERWEGIARWIDTLTPQQQFEAGANAIKAFLLALRSLNVSIQAFEDYRTLWSNKVGYYSLSTESDQYWRGLSTAVVKDRLQGGPFQGADWRYRAWRTWKTAQPSPERAMNRSFDAGSVLFGLAADYPPSDSPNFGCPWTLIDGWSRCPNPWGECHRVFVQTNSTWYGCRLNSPSELAGRLRGWGQGQVADAVLRGGNGVHITDQPGLAVNFFAAIGPAGWNQWMFNAQDTTAVGIERVRKRLYVLVPFQYYVALFLAPQGEFGGGSFAGWIMRDLSQTNGAGVIRKVKRQVAIRNATMAEVHRKTEESLLGTAGREAIDRQIAEERNAGVENSVIAGVGTGVSQLATRINPVAGIITGGITAITMAFRALFPSDPAAKMIDVFGQLMPAFQPFAVVNSRRALGGLLTSTIGWPEGASAANPDPAGVTGGVSIIGTGILPNLRLPGQTTPATPTLSPAFDGDLAAARGTVTAGEFDRAVMADPTLWRTQ